MRILPDHLCSVYLEWLLREVRIYGCLQILPVMCAHNTVRMKFDIQKVRKCFPIHAVKDVEGVQRC